MIATGQIAGNLGFDPELRHTNGGTPVLNLSVANNRSVKIGDRRESVADWFKVVVFGRDAEIIAEYAKKGSALAFNGRLQNEKYTDREGIQRTSTVLIASSFDFLPSKKKDGEASGEASTDAVDLSSELNEPDDEIPF
jgi:single-strand DNA-binding protein